jgi:catechol 2,3-dioxygenase-like lactoylglutathione lyase family enzyme
MRLLLTVALALLWARPAPAQLARPNAAGVTFAHVHLNVTDVEVHKKLWVEQFDGVVVQKGSLVTVKFPGQLVVFTERAPTGGSQGTVMDHFGFKVRSLAEVLASWRAAGLEVQSEFTGAEGFPNAYVVAPDGVRFELQEDPDLRVKAEAYHIHFFTPDYQELLDWYVDVFSAVQAPRGTIQSTANVPGQNLSFANSREAREPTQGRAIDHIGFEVDNLEAFVQTLEARGIEFDVPYRVIDSIGLAIAFFTDPSGVRIELTEGFDEY